MRNRPSGRAGGIAVVAGAAVVAFLAVIVALGAQRPGGSPSRAARVVVIRRVYVTTIREQLVPAAGPTATVARPAAASVTSVANASVPAPAPPVVRTRTS